MTELCSPPLICCENLVEDPAEDALLATEIIFSVVVMAPDEFK